MGALTAGPAPVCASVRGTTEAVLAVSLCLRLLGPQFSDILSPGGPVSSRLCSTLSHPRGPWSSCGRSLKSVSLAWIPTDLGWDDRSLRAPVLL